MEAHQCPKCYSEAERVRDQLKAQQRLQAEAAPIGGIAEAVAKLVEAGLVLPEPWPFDEILVGDWVRNPDGSIKDMNDQTG